MAGDYKGQPDVYGHALARLSPAAPTVGEDHWAVLHPQKGAVQYKLERKPTRGGWDDPYLDTRAQGVRLARQLQAALGDRWDSPDVGWVKCPRTGVWCILERQWLPRRRQLLREPPVLCCVHMSRDEGRWTSFSWCDRPVAPDGDRCQLHMGVARKRQAREDAYQQRRQAEREDADRERLQREDLRELWAMACDAAGVDEDRRGDPRVSRGSAVVDLEVLSMFLRTLVDRL